MKVRLFWIRNDFRINDNKALYAACKDQEVKLLTVFIATPVQWRQHNMSPRQAVFIYENLLQMEIALAKCGIPLVYHQCDNFDASIKWLKNFCEKENISEVFYNRQYEINERRRDEKLEEYFGKQITFKGFDDHVIIPPGEIVNNNFVMYKKYTPFRESIIKKFLKLEIYSFPAPKIRQHEIVIKRNIPFFNYPYQKFDKMFPAGEEEAIKKLGMFFQDKIKDYNKLRNLLEINTTSCLSPYLAIGVLSPRQCISQLFIKYPNFLEKRNSGPFFWFNELIWREFYYHLIVAYPHLSMGKSFLNWADNIVWNKDNKVLWAWKRGLTGYPIVDAAMRQLNTTGWIHNRLRMIAASFLVKDLLIDWRVGEHYFMSQLLDGTLSANNGGWQWAASTGTDAAPYLRIFNPTTQGKNFDPKGFFIRKWVPELYNVPERYIHNPHDWLRKNRDFLEYPLPVVDHQKARQNTLSVFRKAKILTFLKKSLV